MSSVDNFAKKVRGVLKVRPMLPFGAPVKIGAIAVLEDDQFVPRGNVESILGVKIDPQDITTGKLANWQQTSGKDVKLGFLASGEASKLFPSAPAASAKIELTFQKEESFLVSVSKLNVSTLTNPASLIKRILDAHERGVWRKDYIVVYETITPEHTLILLSRSAKSEFLLSAKATVAPPQGTAEIAGNFQLSFQKQDAVHFDSGGQPLFFNAYRVKRGFFSGRVSVKSFAVADPTGGVFERV